LMTHELAASEAFAGKRIFAKVARWKRRILRCGLGKSILPTGEVLIETSVPRQGANKKSRKSIELV